MDKCLNKIAVYYHVPPGKIFLQENSLPMREHNNKTTRGVFNIILQFQLESGGKSVDFNKLEDALVRQWVEYTILNVLRVEDQTGIYQVLKELNGVLETRTYLISHKLTIADVFLYYSVQKIMENLSILDKEKFINVSRWFDNLQQDSRIRQNSKIVDFNTNYLASLAPARH